MQTQRNAVPFDKMEITDISLAIIPV
ncbi:hypothetical protein LCGC14_2896980, partial [marine sediment metagenome]